MMKQSREREQEENRKHYKPTPSSNHRNPRIVRVSRSFGGKDRHSKVCTVRGLRDRRIRLSVPTAIQLYDLQEKLGVSQPSKVVDWLLHATKDDINKLPPLPIIPLTFPHSSPPLLLTNPHKAEIEQGPSFHTYYDPYLHWDHPNLSLPNQQQDSNSQPYFPSYITPSMEINVQQNPLSSMKSFAGR